MPDFDSNVNVSMSFDNKSGLCGGILGSCDDESLFDRSFWYSFIIGVVFAAASFMYYCAPWTEFKKRRSNVIYPLRKKQNHQKYTRKVAELLPLALQEKRSKEVLSLSQLFFFSFNMDPLQLFSQQHLLQILSPLF